MEKLWLKDWWKAFNLFKNQNQDLNLKAEGNYRCRREQIYLQQEKLNQQKMGTRVWMGDVRVLLIFYRREN